MCCTAKKSVKVMHSYSIDRKHITKINNCFSDFFDLLIGVQQGSISLLFNIYICNLFFFIEDEIVTSYIDDTTTYSDGNNVVTSPEDRETT